MILQQTRGALSSGDQLALDLPFAETKSLTARLGPTPTFTRASSGTFVGSNGLIQLAANNEPRFDHDPVTLSSRGLFIEDSRTNLSRRSGVIVFGNGWFIDNATSTASGTGPDGNTSYRIAESTATGVHTCVNTGGTTVSGATSVTNGTVYTGSIFLKKVDESVDWVQLTFGAGGFGTTAYANFNIGNGTIGNSAGLASGTSPRIEDFGNGWYRCSISVAATASTSTTSNVIVGFIQNTNGTSRLPSYTGNTSNRFLASLCQFEAGSFATSYIPTTTASVVRSADVCSITGAAFISFCNQTEGTLSLKSTILATTVSMGGVVISAPDRFNCSVDISISNSTTINTIVRSNYGTQASFNFTNNTSGSENRTIIAFEQNNFAASSNGSTVLTDNLGVFNTNTYPLTQMHIGTNIGSRMFGWISEIKYYRRRLPNAKLQALTAP